MNHRLALTVAAALLLCCTACGSKDQTRGTADAPTTAAATSSSADSGSGGGHDSSFCNLARKIGKDDLGVSEGNQAPDTGKLLDEVDELDNLAPDELRSDFDVYASFEHAVLDPGSSGTPVQTGDAATALTHVAVYFKTTCGVHG